MPWLSFSTARTVQRWQFTNGGREFFVDPRGSLTVNDTATLIALAKRGLGLAYTADILIEPELASGELKAVLKSHLSDHARSVALFSGPEPAAAETSGLHRYREARAAEIGQRM